MKDTTSTKRICSQDDLIMKYIKKLKKLICFYKKYKNKH